MGTAVLTYVARSVQMDLAAVISNWKGLQEKLVKCWKQLRQIEGSREAQIWNPEGLLASSLEKLENVSK